MNYLNENLKTNFVWYLEKESRSTIETWSCNRALNKEHFYGKSIPKVCTESNQKTLFNLGK